MSYLICLSTVFSLLNFLRRKTTGGKAHVKAKQGKRNTTSAYHKDKTALEWRSQQFSEVSEVTRRIPGETLIIK